MFRTDNPPQNPPFIPSEFPSFPSSLLLCLSLLHSSHQLPLLPFQNTWTPHANPTPIATRSHLRSGDASLSPSPSSSSSLYSSSSLASPSFVPAMPLLSSTQFVSPASTLPLNPPPSLCPSTSPSPLTSLQTTPTMPAFATARAVLRCTTKNNSSAWP